MIRKCLPIICFLCALTATAQRDIPFNSYWNFRSVKYGVDAQNVTLPRAWNEDYAFRVPIADLPSDTVRYTRSFVAPKSWKGKKVFVEFEGVRQAAQVWINGFYLGRHENGVMAFGVDLSPYVNIGKANLLEVLTDNDWDYREREYKPQANDQVLRDGNNLPNNQLQPGTFQWNNKNFNANYGGIPKNVKMHVVGRLYQTLPLYSSLGTTGTYIYATQMDVAHHSAVINAESEVKNETDHVRTFDYLVEVIDPEGKQVAQFRSVNWKVGKGETINVKASALVHGLHFWSWGYGYLYTVRTSLMEGKDNVDMVQTVTGFRKTEFANGQLRLNDRTLMVHGYAQRTSNEWPGVGMSVPAWLSDYSNGLMVESGGNLVRWMHVCPWKQDIESCDRVGLLQAMPAGDAEKDVTGRQWQHRLELMRDAIIYNRNNPSIIFYECGNKGISEQHMAEMKAIRNVYDPHGGRAIGSREMLSNTTEAEYGGEMLYINKSAGKPVWAMEYCRDEGLRRYWDDWSYPYHKEGVGPLYRNEDASAYNHNSDQMAIEMVRRWYDYWLCRPGTGSRVSGGGVKIVFSDTNTHNRSESNYRTSGVVDPMRIEKDAFYAHQVMWNGWVTPDSSITHIIGHWNYNESEEYQRTGKLVKPVYVVSDAPHVKLFVNGEEQGKERIDYHFLHTFDNISYVPGRLKAVSYDDNWHPLSSCSIETAGKPLYLVMGIMTRDCGMQADGADMALIEVEVTDEDYRRCAQAHNMIHFEIDGPIEWIGGIGHAEEGAVYHDINGKIIDPKENPNLIRSVDLPLECGVTRALVRSTGKQAGKAHVLATSPRLVGAKVEIVLQKKATPLRGSLVRGETPSTPSYRDTKMSLRPANVVAGCNQADAAKSIDDNEETEWKNDGNQKTAWIRYEFERPVLVDEVSMKLTGWRRRSYPIEILADGVTVWSGNTQQSLGYVYLPLDLQKIGRRPFRNLTIRLKGKAKSKEAFGAITELAQPVANELDLYKAKDGDKVNSELRIVECDFLRYLND